MLKIVFMGTPDFAQKSLQSIVDAGYNIEAVVTNPDRPKGRGMKMIASPVKEYALVKNIKIYQPEKIRKNTEFIEEIKKINPDVICVVAYGKILPKELLDIPRLGCINVHGSLLPKYRGAAPIQWAVINGEKVTGITTMYMDIGMDTGDMILKQEVEIEDNETTGELWERLSDIGGKLLVETLEKIENGTAPRIPQGEEFTMAPMLDKEMSKIDWNKSGIEIKNLVRGLNPIMGTYTYINDKKYKFWKVDFISFEKFIEEFNINNLEELKNMQNGEICYSNEKEGLFLKAEDGIIKVLEIQAENAKKMDIKDFLRGNKI